MYSDDSTKKIPNCMENFQYYIREYSDYASIHGLRYLWERKRSLIERLWWLVFLSVSLCFCTISIVEAYKKWERSPVMVTFATSETPIWNIPFPAVTICPEVKTNLDKFNFTRLLELYEKRNLTAKQQKQLHYMALICATPQNTYFNNIEGNDFTNNEPAEFFMKVRPPFEFITESCYWSSTDCYDNISSMFVPSLTNDGVCFSFNILDRDKIYTSEMEKSFYNTFHKPHRSVTEWSLETGYTTNPSFFDIPYRTRAAGTAGGLDLILKTYSDELDNICGDFIQGYKVIIHNPREIPNSKRMYFYLGLNVVVLAAVRPRLITTSENLRTYEPNKRKCFFSQEKRLRFYKTYDQHNCLTECLANFTLEYCNCVTFSMPRDRYTRVCGFNSYNCIDEATAELFTNYGETQENTERVFCDCLPSCTSLDFEIEVSESYWNWAESPKKSTFLYGVNTSEKVSRLRVHFKDLQFLALQRNELYGPTDFVASCGGLLSLFIGFSLVSVVEIVYFVTLRLICNIRKFGHKYWSGADELIEVKVTA